MCKKEGYCWASNKWLANQIKVTNRSIQRYLKKLKKWGLIESEVLKEEGNKRRIALSYLYGKPPQGIMTQMLQGYDNIRGIGEL